MKADANIFNRKYAQLSYFQKIKKRDALPLNEKPFAKTSNHQVTAAWSRGMILVSGAGGRGFDSRSSPYFDLVTAIINLTIKAFIIKSESTFSALDLC